MADDNTNELTQEEIQRLEQTLKRGAISQRAFNVRVGNFKVEAWQVFFTSNTTKRITTEEFEAIYFKDGFDMNREWWQWVKDEVMQEGDELWYWNNISGFAGSMGIVLVRGDTVIMHSKLGQG